MLSALKRLLNPGSPTRRTIETIYGTIVAQAREPVFYQALGVPDTVDGRFDMVLLHLWLVLRRLRRVGGGEDLSQALFDHFCRDMDANLREMGVGDLTVPKRMKKFGEAFYGRTAAYDAALEQGRQALAGALGRNILNSHDASRAAPLADYVDAAIAALEGVDAEALRQGAWRFPAPKVPA
jgi:cytochrome b pre-mRNA-processing protein 3